MKKILPVVFGLILLSWMHPFYLSVTDLKYHIKDRTFQGTVKIFSNDFEKALSQYNKGPVDLLHPRDSSALKLLIQHYLNAHLHIKAGNQALQLKVIGFEHEEEATWTYVESSPCDPQGRVEVESNMLLEQLPEQSNIVQLELNAKKLNYKLSTSERKHVFVF
jgi:hypothetical protein